MAATISFMTHVAGKADAADLRKVCARIRVHGEPAITGRVSTYDPRY